VSHLKIFAKTFKLANVIGITSPTFKYFCCRNSFIAQSKYHIHNLHDLTILALDLNHYQKKIQHADALI